MWLGVGVIAGLSALVSVGAPVEGPHEMAKRLIGCFEAKDAPCLYEHLVVEEKRGHRLSLGQYRAFLDDYVWSVVQTDAPVGMAEFAEVDARTTKLYGLWHYGMELEASKTYRTKSGRTFRLRFGIVSVGTGHRVNGMIANVLDAAMIARHARENAPSPFEQGRARLRAAEADAERLASVGVRGVWRSPKEGFIPMTRYAAQLRKSYSASSD